MYIKKSIPFLLLSMLLLQSVHAQRKNIDQQSIKKSITEVLDAQVTDWNNGDIENYMKGYAEIDSVRFASGSSVSYGWRNMLDRYKKGYPDKAVMGTLSFSEIDITVLSKESAIVFGKWSLKGIKDEPWGYFTLLLRKRIEGWRIVHDHTSLAQSKKEK